MAVGATSTLVVIVAFLITTCFTSANDNPKFDKTAGGKFRQAQSKATLYAFGLGKRSGYIGDNTLYFGSRIRLEDEAKNRKKEKQPHERPHGPAGNDQHSPCDLQALLLKHLAGGKFISMFGLNEIIRSTPKTTDQSELYPGEHQGRLGDFSHAKSTNDAPESTDQGWFDGEVFKHPAYGFGLGKRSVTGGKLFDKLLFRNFNELMY